jgi:prepilin signal peptidase PulO-like enzyme (type II secretory pathway)
MLRRWVRKKSNFMKSELFAQYGLFLLVAAPISLFDIRELRIPDFLTLGGVILLVALELVLRQSTLGVIALECCVGYGSFWTIHRLSKGGMGLGDAKFSALVAVAVGILPWVVAVLVASLAGLAFAACAILVLGKERKTRVPFAPFLTLGALVAMAVRPHLPGV